MEKQKAVIIYSTGEKKVVEFTEANSYATLSGAVGGMIERVTIKGGLDMWVNEEGKMLRLAHNPIATGLWADVYGTTNTIEGNVIITGGADEDGNTIGLNDFNVDLLLSYDRKLWTMEAFMRDSFA